MTEYIEREKAFDAVFGQFCASSDETEAAPNAAIDEIEQIPAADVRPVVRGKWKHGVCQTCFFDWSEVAPLASVPNFCPNCGARMEVR